MHITRRTPTELVVEDSSLWISYICAGAGFLLLLAAIAQHKSQGFVPAAFFLLFAAIFERKITFTFDATQRVVRWSGFKLFKRDSGSIPFDEVTEIGTQASLGTSEATYRLTILTVHGSIPMAYTYAGRADGYGLLRQQILDFVKPGAYVPTSEPGILSSGVPADLEPSIRSLLAQGPQNRCGHAPAIESPHWSGRRDVANRCDQSAGECLTSSASGLTLRANLEKPVPSSRAETPLHSRLPTLIPPNPITFVKTVSSAAVSCSSLLYNATSHRQMNDTFKGLIEEWHQL